MDVLLEATCLSGDGGSSGLGVYARGLLGALAALDGSRPMTLHALVTTEAALDASVDRVEVSRRWVRGVKGLIENELRVPGELRRPGIDVVHSLSPAAPRSVRRPWVQTLFDVIPLTDPSTARPVRWAWRVWGPRYRRADAVTAISAYTAEVGCRILDLDPARVHVVPLGVDASFTPDGPPAREATGQPYVLVVGEHSTRKRFDHAFEAIGRLASRGREHRLIVAGRLNPWNRDELEQWRRASPAPDRIELHGFVDDLPALYRGASAVLVTSAHEGFGLPALEAMASGAPVVAYSNTATAEVVTGAGVMVADGDVDALTSSLDSVLTSSSLARELSEAGRARAKGFTWRATAAATAEIYRSLAD